MSKRYEELDSLRGLAAVSVFLSHIAQLSIISTPFMATLNKDVAHVLWDGSASVDLFFVLSGFVLALPYVNSVRRIDFIPFWIRRVFRIYPAYYAALMVAAVLRVFMFDPHGLQTIGLSTWGQLMWPTVSLSLSLHTLVRYAFLILPMHNTSLDPVMWSLIIEMRESFIFPFVIIAIKNTSKVWHFGVVAIFSLVIVLYNHGEATSSFLLLFMMGGYLAKYRLQIVDIIQNSPSFVRGLLWAVALILYESRFGLHVSEQFANYITGIGAFISISCILASPYVARALNIGPIHFTGKVSYSLYLLHLPILLTSVSLIYPFTHSMILVATISLSITLTMSFIMYKVVEVPLQKLGKLVSGIRPLHMAPPSTASPITETFSTNEEAQPRLN